MTRRLFRIIVLCLVAAVWATVLHYAALDGAWTWLDATGPLLGGLMGVLFGRWVAP